MPFIDSKVTLPMTEDKKETIKAKLGQAITTLNKSEGFLMVGFDDDYTLYMGGKKLEKKVHLWQSACLETLHRMPIAR